MELLDKIDMMIGERQASKRRKREKKKDWERKQVGVKKRGQKSQAQKQYAGHGSIKDLANEDIFEE